MTAPRTLALSIHAGYACGRTGACCTSGWAIGVEPEVAATLRGALASGQLRVTHAAPLAAAPPGGPAAVLAVDAHGRCAFFRPGAPHACAIHSTLGHDALPMSCRQFPRVALLGPDTVRVSLSHYCPTAAGLLFRDTPLGIVNDPPAFPAAGAYEGLDARRGFGPLLRPRVLLGWDGFAVWEEHAVRTLAGAPTPERALDRLHEDAETLAGWTPGRGPLVEWAREVLAESREALRTDRRLAPAVALRDRVVRAIPSGVARPRPLPGALAAADQRHVVPAWPALGAPVRRYLAARAFGAWIALQGTGPPANVRYLEAVMAVVRVEAARLCALADAPLDAPRLLEAFRAADLLLIHLASPESLALAI